MIVPVKGENVETLNGLLENLSSSNYPLDKLEVVVVSDDDPTTFDSLTRELRIPPGLEVHLLRREERRGYKSAALAYGLWKTKGELILTLDVDSRVLPGSIAKAVSKMEREQCDAVTLTWKGYSNSDSVLAKALITTTSFGSTSLLLGRYLSGMKIFPVGSGTIYRRTSLLIVKGWDPDVIQDDLDLGARMISRGMKICASEGEVLVEVPDNLRAYYVQQTRWAMGSMEVLSRKLGELMNSETTLIQKLDLLFYMMQYIPVVTTFIGAIVLAVLSPWQNFGYVFAALLTIWLILLGIYSSFVFALSRREGFGWRDSLLGLGRLSAYTVAISPFIFMWTLRAFSKRRKYVVTPKGRPERTRIVYVMLLFGAAFLASSIVYIMRFEFLPGLWLLYYAFPYLYTPYKHLRE
ncbi:glycosyl transferase family 2 [Sulfodiicoccus acidiphilus]|uniref:Glycosyl transferase family 2 n=1 Tax=Sulfodiicoccus acidiphilus TaxID=1670455 RepID=A0A348B6V2_9CREN|nr:glycosyl transferase family 2 [Sulfodiicoccus acidiphilus]GGT95974.1 glycosyl transferase family 2 [Sulfodiicoccus acidiphilus]